MREYLGLRDFPSTPNALPVSPAIVPVVEVSPLLGISYITSGSADVHVAGGVIYTVPAKKRLRLRLIWRALTTGSLAIAVNGAIAGQCKVTLDSNTQQLVSLDLDMYPGDNLYMSQGAVGDTGVAWSLAGTMYDSP